MLFRLAAASTLLAAAFTPLAVGAQDLRTSPVQNFHLVQLSVNADEVAPLQFMAKTEAIRSCSDAAELRKTLGAEMTRNRFVRASSLPGDLRAIVEGLSVGQSTPVYTYNGAELNVLVLCNRV